jgi:hypothetical protein
MSPNYFSESPRSGGKRSWLLRGWRGGLGEELQLLRWVAVEVGGRGMRRVARTIPLNTARADRIDIAAVTSRTRNTRTLRVDKRVASDLTDNVSSLTGIKLYFLVDGARRNAAAINAIIERTNVSY